MANNKLVPSLIDTIFEPTIYGMSDSLADIADVAIDSVFDTGLLKDFPFFGTVVSLCKTGANLREKNLIRQTAIFIDSFRRGNISDDELINYRYKLESDSKRAEKEIGRIILLLDRALELQQSKVLGKLYQSFVNENITWEQFAELSEVNSRMFTEDYTELSKIYITPIDRTEAITGESIYKIQRLVSLGLVAENRFGMWGGGLLKEINEKYRFAVTDLGKMFNEQGINDANISKGKKVSSIDNHITIDPLNPKPLTPSQRAQFDALNSLTDDTVRKEAEADSDCEPLE